MEKNDLILHIIKEGISYIPTTERCVDCEHCKLEIGERREDLYLCTVFEVFEFKVDKTASCDLHTLKPRKDKGKLRSIFSSIKKEVTSE